MTEARDALEVALESLHKPTLPSQSLALSDLILAALPDGWVLARRDDAEDGAALRELAEAWSGTWSVHVVRSAGRVVGYTVEAWSTKTWPTVKVYGPDDDSMPDVQPTIAAAARKAKEALG